MKTVVLKTDTREAYREAVKAAAEVLDSGGIVGIPTETVYGLAAGAEHPVAMERLRRIKKRPDEKKFTICIPLKSDLRRFVPNVPRAADKLITRFWPGPVTLVLPGAGDAAVGLRMPALSLTRDVLLAADTTAVIPSANPHGQKPALRAREVLEYFDGSIELVLDGENARLGVASTVVEVTADGQTKILRQGAIGPEELKSALAHTILFVCTGNMCRSPMAEGIARKALADRLNVSPDKLDEAGFRVASAGTTSFGGSPPSPEAVTVMREAGVDIGHYISQPLSIELLRDADEIYVMEPHHLDALKAIDFEAAARAKLVAPDGRAVDDPIGQPLAVYRAVRDRLISAIKDRLKRTVNEDRNRK